MRVCMSGEPVAHPTPQETAPTNHPKLMTAPPASPTQTPLPAGADVHKMLSSISAAFDAESREREAALVTI